MKKENKIKFVSCLLISVLVLISYLPAKDLSFLSMDDDVYVTDNLMVQKGLTVEGVLWSFSTFDSANWHPVTWISHMMDCELYGMFPAGHHWTNVQIHLLSTLLLFLFFYKYTEMLWQSILVATLFGVHPMHVESVAWVSERKDVLSAFFGILMLLAYGRYVKSPNLKNYFFVFIFLVLGLMSKPMLVTFPFVLLLLDIWPFKRIKTENINLSDTKAGLNFIISNRYLLIEKIPFLFPVAVSSFLTIIAQSSKGAMSSLETLTIFPRISNAVVSYIAYIFKLLVPIKLSVFYPHPMAAFPLWKVFISIFLILIITLATVRMVRKFPFLFVGWAWFMVTLIPVIGLVQVGRQAMADRYTYIPSIGLFVFCVWGISFLMPKLLKKKTIIFFASVAVVSVYSILTFIQVGYWKNGVVLFSRTISVLGLDELNPYYASVLFSGLAIEHYGLKDDEKAISNYQRALFYNPNNVEALNNLANILKKHRKYDDALTFYQRSLDIKPNDEHFHNNIAAVYLDTGEFEKAVHHFKKALELKPDYVEANYNLANLFFKTGKLSESAFYYEKALELNRNYIDANFNYALLLKKQGKTDLAAKHLATVIDGDPKHYRAYNELGILFFQQKMPHKAKKFFEKSVSLKPDYLPALNNLKAIGNQIPP